MVRHLIAAATFTIVCATVAQTSAFGQTVAKPITTPDGQPLTRRQRAPDALPSAVPGARAEPDLVAPAERSSVDMPPTEALFDSINRGDVVSAREAIGRGADIHGRNVLGLTPLEQSVDLGRNEISFLLLSLRGGAGYATGTAARGGAPAPAQAAQSASNTPATTRAERRAAAQEAARAHREQVAESRASRSPAAPATSRNARLFAGDGGAPVPQAGFLGFDSAR